jgi:hypothetical protein
MQKKLLIYPVKEKLTTAVNLTYVKLTAFSLGPSPKISLKAFGLLEIFGVFTCTAGENEKVDRITVQTLGNVGN